MIDGYKVVTCSPVGRKRYVEVLVKYLLQLRHVIDKHVFWINTFEKDDLENSLHSKSETIHQQIFTRFKTY